MSKYYIEEVDLNAPSPIIRILTDRQGAEPVAALDNPRSILTPQSWKDMDAVARAYGQNRLLRLPAIKRDGKWHIVIISSE